MSTPVAAAPDTETMGAHCFVCKARFRIPLHPTATVRCPDCGSTQVIDHNLAPISRAEAAGLHFTN